MPTFSFQGVIHTTKTSPWNNSYRPKLCRLCCTLTTTKLPPPGAGFLGLQNHCVKIQKFSQRTNSCAVSKSLNWCRVSVQKAALLGDRKNVLAPHGRTSGAIPPPKKKILWVRTMVPHLYSRFHPNPFSTEEKPFHNPPKWMQYTLFEPISILQHKMNRKK